MLMKLLFKFHNNFLKKVKDNSYPYRLRKHQVVIHRMFCTLVVLIGS